MYQQISSLNESNESSRSSSFVSSLNSLSSLSLDLQLFDVSSSLSASGTSPCCKMSWKISPSIQKTSITTFTQVVEESQSFFNYPELTINFENKSKDFQDREESSFNTLMKPWKHLLNHDYCKPCIGKVNLNSQSNLQSTNDIDSMDTADDEINFFPPFSSTPNSSFFNDFSYSDYHSFPEKEQMQQRPYKRKRQMDSVLFHSNKENQPNKKVRRKLYSKKSESKLAYCEYCKRRGEPLIIYKHHTLKDAKGRTLCPTLRQIECPICKSDGDKAHEKENCPQKYLENHSEAELRCIQRRLSCIKI